MTNHKDRRNASIHPWGSDLHVRRCLECFNSICHKAHSRFGSLSLIASMSTFPAHFSFKLSKTLHENCYKEVVVLPGTSLKATSRSSFGIEERQDKVELCGLRSVDLLHQQSFAELSPSHSRGIYLGIVFGCMNLHQPSPYRRKSCRFVGFSVGSQIDCK